MNRLMIQEEPGDYLIEGREDRIRQVLINLIDNAIKYGKTGEDIWIRLVKRDAVVQIAVANQGRGMDKEFRTWACDLQEDYGGASRDDSGGK